MQLTAQTEKAGSVTEIEYHADDFGLFSAQSQRILDCHIGGKLNGVSVMPNSEALDASMALLRPYRKEVSVSVHLNLIEGRSLCDHRDVPLLTDTAGIFHVSFGKILLHSVLPDRNAYKMQIKQEFRAQIQALSPYLDKDVPLRLDGHAHYHMLPVAFDALMEIIQEDQLNVGYIRIPREHPTLYLRHWRKLRKVPAINLVKVFILNLLAWRNHRKYQKYLDQLEQRLFLGVALSGHMHQDNVACILPDAIALAGKQGQNLEILAHPGGVYEAEDIEKLTNPDDIAFLTSHAREKEVSLFSK